jgi:hypothetical protein
LSQCGQNVLHLINRILTQTKFEATKNSHLKTPAAEPAAL